MRPTQTVWDWDEDTAEEEQPEMRGHVAWLRDGRCDVADVLITVRDMVGLLTDDTPGNVSGIRTWVSGEARGTIWIRLRAEEIEALGEGREDGGAHEIGTLLDYLDDWWTAHRYWNGWQELDARWDPWCMPDCAPLQVLTQVGPDDGDAVPVVVPTYPSPAPAAPAPIVAVAAAALAEAAAILEAAYDPFKQLDRWFSEEEE